MDKKSDEVLIVKEELSAIIQHEEDLHLALALSKSEHEEDILQMTLDSSSHSQTWKRAQSALQTTPAEADDAVCNSRHVELNNGEFYRGVADAGENGFAQLLSSLYYCGLRPIATHIYFSKLSFHWRMSGRWGKYVSS